MMGVSSDLQYTCLARHEKRTGFGVSEPSETHLLATLSFKSRVNFLCSSQQIKI